VYQIESADSLTDIGSQGLQWVIRESDCASKGTNAEWMDVGDSQWIPRILPPRFQPMRFYRVTKVKQATLTPPPTVTLQLDQSNLVSGFIYATMNLSYADTNQQMSSVKLFVDGQEIYTTTDESSSTYINSSEWPNGQHEIYAVATTVDTGETLPDSDDETATNAANFAIAVSDSQFATFSKYISEFFVSTPFFDPANGQTQEIVATFPEDTCWNLYVLDYNFNPVREFSGQSSTLYAAWDGTDGNDNQSSDSFYDYYIQARPSQFGCPPAAFSMSSTTMSSAISANSETTSAPSQGRPARIQFNKLSGIDENVSIPSLNPTLPPAEETAATANTDPDYYVTHSFVPIYNVKQPGRYQWLPLPGMDFGKSDGSSPLMWMGLYGCYSLRDQDFIDMWTKFELPFPPNLRLLLGSEEGIFIHPVFGIRFADDLNTMTIVDAWCDAAGYADKQTAKSLKWRFLMGTRHMTYAYRDDSQGGSWKTSQDSIWNWSNDISYDWYDVSFQSVQVYP